MRHDAAAGWSIGLHGWTVRGHRGWWACRPGCGGGGRAQRSSGDPARGGAPLASRIIYPSPRLLDIDLDGTLELVVGDLPGRVHVAEKADGDDPYDWSALSNFATDGRPLKFHNW